MNKQAAETATLGGGCFWCMEAIMDSLKGVERVVSGYAGGQTEAPTYEQVCGGHTGHAEVVQLQFIPQVISYADILRVFLCMHNPTTLNRQGADAGTQYRSIILYHNRSQQATATKVIAEMQAYFDKPMVTEVVPLLHFYRAEERHQQYYSSNPEKAYCQRVISPKLHRMQEYFGSSLKRKSAQPG